MFFKKRILGPTDLNKFRTRNVNPEIRTEPKPIVVGLKLFQLKLPALNTTSSCKQQEAQNNVLIPHSYGRIIPKRY